MLMRFLNGYYGHPPRAFFVILFGLSGSFVALLILAFTMHYRSFTP